jgi:titin
MANRNFDSHVIIQRLQNRIYSRNLYNNNTTGQRLINNPQTTDGNSSRYVPYHEGAQTEYFRTLQGTTMVSQGGIANIPPYPTPPAPPFISPAAPSSLVATPGNTQVSVAFTQGSTGGSPITNYEYSIDGGVTFIACSPPVTTSPVVITGLTNGTTYSIKLKAVNAIGTSGASAAVSATPATVPDAPTLVSASNGNARATINFTQGSDGGSPILNYYYSTDNGASFSACSPIVTTSPVIITGLTNGTTYQIRLKALNIIGLSDVSDDISVTPLGPPDAPTSLVATPGNAQASIAFTQGFDGGSPITNYYYSTDNGATFYTLSPPDTASPVVITGLTNGTTYQIKLKAVNIAGESAASDAVSATPIGPTILTYSIVRSYTWTAPTGITSIDYLVVGGGGGSGGGYDTGGGGGGGGGMVLSGTLSVTPGTVYDIVVGDGGMGGTSVRTSLPEINGSPGNDSSFDTIVALGGSGGYASRHGNPSANNGGGSAAIDPTTASNGGNGGGSIGDGNGSGGGGGGSLGNGANGAPSLGGAGGSGTVNSISGSALTYGKGGQGARGGINNNSAAGAPNTGNGANAAGATSSSYRNGAKGGSGVVIISYTA